MTGETPRDGGHGRPSGRGEVLWLAAPPAAALCFILAGFAAEAAGVRSCASPVASTVSEAAALGDAARLVELIQQGQDPNRSWPVPQGALDSGRWDVAPIDAAILGRTIQMVRLLQRHGAASPDPERSACLARLRGLPEALPLLGRTSADVEVERIVDPADAVRMCGAGDAPP